MIGLDRIAASEITPPTVYFNRRVFMNAGQAAASLLTTGFVYRRLNRPSSSEGETAELSGLQSPKSGKDAIASGFRVDEPMTPLALFFTQVSIS